jgi:hypothetical protein
MKAWLARLGAWLTLRYGPPAPPATPANGNPITVTKEMFRKAYEVCQWAEHDVPNASGENKRYRALAKMREAFPSAPTRMLSLAIEVAIFELRFDEVR